MASKSGGPPAASSGARSAKYCSKPPGEISSSTRVSPSLALQNACGIPRLDHELAGSGLDHLVAHHGAHATAEDVGVLVLVTVGVDGGGERPRGDRVLDESEAPSR